MFKAILRKIGFSLNHNILNKSMHMLHLIFDVHHKILLRNVYLNSKSLLLVCNWNNYVRAKELRIMSVSNFHNFVETQIFSLAIFCYYYCSV